MKRKPKEDPAMNPTPRHSHTQRRAAAFGLNMIVMAVCFALYYLGFFGGVEGPLNMAAIGKHLAGIGFTAVSFQLLLVLIFLACLTWNWVLNLIGHMTGQGLTCAKGSPQEGFCGEFVQRSRDTTGKGWTYTCTRGHCLNEAHFHPIRKGKLANSLLMASLAAALMFYFA
jgi:hypothetical protein